MYQAQYLHPRNNSVANSVFIKELLSKRNLKVCPLARKLGFSKHTLMRLVEGKTQKPDIRILCKLSEVLNVEVRDILKNPTRRTEIF